MKKVIIATVFLAAAVLFVMPAAAQQLPYDSMTMDASQSYLRLGFDDNITLTISLLDQGYPSGAENVPVSVKVISGGNYVTVVKDRTVTNGTGEATDVIRLNPDVQPDREKLPMLVLVEASVIGNDGIKDAFAMIYITNTGRIRGYVLDETGSTITGARITVTTPDGKAFPGGPYLSYDQSPMGYYVIDDLPILPTGRFMLTAVKNGYSGTCQAEPGYDNIQYNINITGYRESIDVPSIVIGNANATPTLKASGSQETPTRPTTKTTTILIAIALITLVYIGLKTYRRMF